MQTKTALAVAGSVLAVPSTALAAATHDSDTPGREALRASGRLTHDEGTKDRLVRTNLRLARREARLSDDRLPTGYARRVRDDAVSVIRAAQPAPAPGHRPPRAPRRRPPPRRCRRSPPASPAATRRRSPATACSTGSTSSRRRPGHRVGGTGDPAAASEAEQDARAAMLYAQAGASPWPVCGSRR